MIGRCTPVEMGVEDAMRMGYTLEISTSAMEEMWLVRNPVAGKNKYCLNVNYKVTSGGPQPRTTDDASGNSRGTSFNNRGSRRKYRGGRANF